MIKICFLKFLGSMYLSYLDAICFCKKLASILLLSIKKNSFPLQYFSSLFLVLTISSSLQYKKSPILFSLRCQSLLLPLLPSVPYSWCPHLYVIRSRMDNNDIWFLTDSWLNIVYDVVCCCTWMCFYLYMVNLSWASCVFHHGIANYTNMSPGPLLGIPHFCD